MQNPPPVQANNQPPAQVSKSSTGLDENVAALLSYILNWVSGLVFFLIEKDSRLVRFHSMQSILLGAVAAIVLIGLWILSFIVVIVLGQISGLLSTLVSLVIGLLSLVSFVAFVIAWVMCLIKAYQGQFYKLPLLGAYAEKFSMK
jgi:uncharacterized membrane protein